MTNKILSIALVAALAVGAGGWGWALVLKKDLAACKAKRPAVQSFTRGDDVLAAELVARDTDAAGMEHATFDVTANSDLDRRALAAAAPYARAIRQKIDSAAQSVGAKPREVDAVWQVRAAAAEQQVKFQARVIDSMGRATRSYRGPFLSVTARDGDPADSTDNGSFDYRYALALNTVAYTKRDRVLGLRIGQPRRYLDISSPDSNVTIGGANYLTLEQRRPFFGLLLQAQGTVSTPDFKTYRYYVGPGVRFDFGDYADVSLNYLVEPATGRTSKTLSGRAILWRRGR